MSNKRPRTKRAKRSRYAKIAKHRRETEKKVKRGNTNPHRGQTYPPLNR